MIWALLLGFALFAISLYFHMLMLRGAKAVSPPGKDPRHFRLLAGSSLVLLSHLVIAGTGTAVFSMPLIIIHYTLHHTRPRFANITIPRRGMYRIVPCLIVSNP